MLILITVLVFAVAVVLAIGLVSFARAKEGHPRFAQKVMRWRVGLQLLAVIVIMITIGLAAR